MNIYRILACALGVAMLMPVGLRGEVTDLPVTTVKGRKCYYYDVQPKESIYQVTQKLGVSRDELLEGNPSAADGLKPRMRLYFPVDDYANRPADSRKATYAAAAGVTRHTVQKGESLYGIARKYGMTADELAALNPSIADGVRQGDVLVISGAESGAPGADAAEFRAVSGGDGYALYEIKNGETLFSISNRAGVPLESILEANPDLDPMNYTAGDTIRVPVVSDPMGDNAPAIASASAPEVAEAPAQVPPRPAAPVEPAGQVPAAPSVPTPASSTETSLIEAAHATISTPEYNSIAEGVETRQNASQEPLRVAVLLPFMLDEENPGRPAQLFTEFYKGMLMGADHLRTSAGAPVVMEFFDTKGDSETLRGILAGDGVKGADLVVAPDNPAHLAMVMEAVPEETLVLNIFAVKDDTYRNYHNLIQTNIPHDDMYARAIERFLELYADRVPVFIRRTGGQADKDAFTSGLKERLIADGKDFREVTFNTSLSDSDLAGIDPDAIPVVFVPNSGSRNEFAKYVKAITNMRHSAMRDDNVTIFGYPEWVTFRGDSFDEICDLDATIYSRYLAVDTDPAIRDLKEKYRNEYGVEMFEAVPTQGILGYDIAIYAIDALRRMEQTGMFPEEYTGVQSRMQLEWSGATDVTSDGTTTSNGGLVNEALYFINFNPGGNVEWQR